jgi:ribosomal protein S27AE
MDAVADTSFDLSCPQCGAGVRLPEYADAAVCGSCGSTLTREVPRTTWRGAPGVGAASEEQVLRSVRCSQCAGPLSAREGRRVLVCGHCGVRVAVKEHGGFSRWYFPARVDRQEAAGAASAWLEKHPGIAKRAREAPIVEAQLVYAPVWEHKALIAGWEFGRKLRTRYELVGEERSERLDLKLVSEGVEEPRLRERRFYEAATDLAALGATRPRITGRELMLPLLAGEIDSSATVLEAEGSPDQVAAAGRRAAMTPVSGAESPDTHVFTIRESTALLYYPLWLLRYQDGNRSYRIVINGRNGNVNSAEAPAADQVQLALLTFQIVALAALVGLLLWLGSFGEAARMPTIAGAVIVSVVAILLVRRFRLQREVEYHEPFSS